MASTRRDDAPLAEVATQVEITTFLALESELFDSRQFAGWVELVDEDFVYQVPVPLTPDNPVAPAYDDQAFLIEETRETLIGHWFSRYEPEMWEIAWAENPPVRFRHFITNVRVRQAEEADVFDVRSNAIVSAVRQSSPTTTLHVERFDRVRRRDGELRLARRFAVTDESLIDFAQLRVIL